MNFLAGYGIAVISLVQLFFFCEVGEHIEVIMSFDINHFIVREKFSSILFVEFFQNNGFEAMIYNFEWYNLPNKYQNDIMFLIQRKQNAARINAGPFGDINCLLFSVVRSYFLVIHFIRMIFIKIKTISIINTDYEENLLTCDVLIKFSNLRKRKHHV